MYMEGSVTEQITYNFLIFLNEKFQYCSFNWMELILGSVFQYEMNFPFLLQEAL